MFKRLGVALLLCGLTGSPMTPVLTAQSGQGAGQVEDVVYLKDGGVVRGIIVEQRPGDAILIRTRDGNQFRYQMSQIDRLTREPRSGPVAEVRSRKSVPGAVALSFLITGAGQAYNGQWGKGAAFLGVSVLSYAAMAAAANSDACVFDDDCGAVGGWALVWVGNIAWSMIDAGYTANRINRENAQQVSLIVRPNTRVVPGGVVGDPPVKARGMDLGVRLAW